MSEPKAPAPQSRCSQCHRVYDAGERFCPLDGGSIVAEDEQDPLIGRLVLERFFIRRQIGKGGMGVVYEADHVGLDKRVAIKFILDKYAADREALTRFYREGRTAARVGHENIVEVMDVGTDKDGRTYIVMEYLEGFDLAHVLRTDGQLPIGRAIAIMRQVLAGLQAAHDKGVLHRDMKPENVFLTRRHGTDDFVKIMDFGISKFLDARDKNLRLTETGAVVGTPIYMAPEQVQASPDVDHRVDLYAAGVMMYEMLAGRPPFTAASYIALVSQHLNEAAPPLRAVRPEVPVTLALAVHKALEKHPNQRFADAADFARALPDEDALDTVAAASRAQGKGRLAGVAPTVRSSSLPGVGAPTTQRTTLFHSRRFSVGLVVLGLVGIAAALIGFAIVQNRAGEEGGDAPPTLAATPAQTTTAPSAPVTNVAAPTIGPIVSPASASVEIDSSPRDATVLLDGKPVGRTPLVLDDVAVGEHRIALSLKGYDPLDAAKSVRAGYAESFFGVLAPRGSGHSGRVHAGGHDKGHPGGDDKTRPGGDDKTRPGSDDKTRPGGDDKTRPGGDDKAKPGSDRANDGKSNPYLNP